MPRRGQQGMHQGFVVAVFVAAGELQFLVRIQAQVVAVAGHDDALEARGLGVQHLVAVQQVFEPRDHPARGGRARCEQRECADGEPAQAPVARAGHQQPDRREVGHAGEQRGLDRAEAGQQQEREGQRAEQRAEIVQRQRAREGAADAAGAAQQFGQHRQLHADQVADRRDQRDHAREVPAGQQLVRGVQQQPAGAAEHGDRDLDADQAMQDVAIVALVLPAVILLAVVLAIVARHVARGECAHAHGCEEGADGQRELQRAVAVQVGGQRADQQFVDDRRCRGQHHHHAQPPGRDARGHLPPQPPWLRPPLERRPRSQTVS